MQQESIQAQAKAHEEEMQQRDTINARDNETKIMVAHINAQAEAERFALMSGDNDGIEEPEYSQEAKDKLAESMRQFDKRLALDREKLQLAKHKVELDNAIKKQQLNKNTNTK